jgi:hypothetical protein
MAAIMRSEPSMLTDQAARDPRGKASFGGVPTNFVRSRIAVQMHRLMPNADNRAREQAEEAFDRVHMGAHDPAVRAGRAWMHQRVVSISRPIQRSLAKSSKQRIALPQWSKSAARYAAGELGTRLAATPQGSEQHHGPARRHSCPARRYDW